MKFFLIPLALLLVGCTTCAEWGTAVVHHPATVETTWVKSYWTGFPTRIDTPVPAWDETVDVCKAWEEVKFTE